MGGVGRREGREGEVFSTWKRFLEALFHAYLYHLQCFYSSLLNV